MNTFNPAAFVDINKVTLFNQGNPFSMPIERLPKFFQCGNLKELIKEMSNCLETDTIKESNYLDYIDDFHAKHESWVNSHKEY